MAKNEKIGVANPVALDTTTTAFGVVAEVAPVQAVRMPETVMVRLYIEKRA